MPGFQHFRRSDARSANPTSQGATLRALGGNASSRALLMLDGVPQTDPFGGWIAWPAFDPRRLGRIRVTRGGGSGADGPGALAGTIELDSAAPDDLDGPAAASPMAAATASTPSPAMARDLGAGFVSLSGGLCARRRLRARRRAPARARRPALALPPGSLARARGRAALRRRSSSRPISPPSPTSASAAPRSATSTRDGADASLRLVGRGRLPFSALAYVQVRDFANRFAAVNADRATATETLDQYDVPSTGLGARFEIRRSPARSSCGSAPTARATVGPHRRSCSSSSPARRPAAASPAGGPTRSAPSPRRLGAWPADPHRRRADRPLVDRERILRERTLADRRAR